MTWSLVVGTMIGAGIFMLPVSLAPYGPNAIGGWIVSGIGAVALAYSFGRLARDGGHGIQAYIERAFGPFVAFLSTFAFWVSAWVANAAVAIAGGAAIGRIVPELAGDTNVALAAMALVVFLTATNMLGARSTGRLAVLTTLIKILPLAAVVIVLADVSAAGEPLVTLAPMPITIDNIAAATALTLYALLGFETAVAPVNKVRNAERTIPRALIGGTGFVAILYLLVSTAILLLLSVDQAVASTSPFADAIGRSWGEYGALLAAGGIVVSAIGYLNAGVLVAGELGYSMALRRELPALFAKTRRVNTPINAQLLGSALSIALIAANMSKGTADLFTFVALLTIVMAFNYTRTMADLFGFLILLATTASLVAYFVCSLAAVKLGVGRKSVPIFLAAALFSLWAIWGSGVEAMMWGLILLLSGIPIYFVMTRLNSSAATQPAAAPAAPPGSSA